MAKVKMTNMEMIQFIGLANQFLGKEELFTKLVVAVKKQTKIFSKALDDYYEKLEDLRLEFASEDEKKNVLRDEKGQFSYTKESTMKLTAKNKELVNQEVEVEVFLNEVSLANLPEDFQLEFGDLLKIEFAQPLI